MKFQNPEFHATMAELVEWLERTENSIRQTEPVNLADETTVILAKYNKFRVSNRYNILYNVI